MQNEQNQTNNIVDSPTHSLEPDISKIKEELNEQDWINDLADTEREFSGVRPNKKNKKKKTGNKKNKPFRILIRFLIGIIAIVFLIISTFLIMRAMGKSSLKKHASIENVSITAPELEEDIELESDGQVVYYNGDKYIKNNDVISILCMGIDKKEFHTEGEVVGQGGQADSVFLIILDTKSGKTTLLNISRDSMTDVEVYNDKGEYIYTETMQLCLSYSYGDGKKTSCDNTLKSVSRLLYGMPIDAYAAIDLPAISVLNDAIGGVEVVVPEDLSAIAPEFKAGTTITLKGSQAENFVRARDAESEDFTTNNDRMSRQKQYVTNFINKAISETKKDISVPLTLYDAVSEYMVTDMNASKVTYLASLFIEKNFTENNIITVPGEVKMGEQYAEYHVDDKALYEIILDLFYTKEGN